MKRELFKKYELPLSLALISVVAALAYLPYITKTGYYIEDWYLIWSGLTRGTASYIPMFMSDRPFEAYTYVLLFPLFGPSALPWHILLIVFRILGAFSFLWLLRMLWPEKKIETTTMALLFVVYPGFFQHVQAVEFHVHITALFLAITSVTLTVYSLLERPIWKRVISIIIAIGFLIIYPLMMEYYFGLEIVRMLLIGYVIFRNSDKEIRRSLPKFVWNWLPYLITFGGYLYWRIFHFSGNRKATDIGLLIESYKGNPVYMLLGRALELGRDIIETLYLAWAIPFSRYWGSYSEILAKFSIAVAAMGVVGGFYFLAKKWRDASTEDDSIYKQFMLMGSVIIVVCLLPIIAANKDVGFGNREDRFTITAALGVVMLIVGFLFYYFRSRAKYGIVMGLVAISVFAQINYASFMSDFWEAQRQFWWQVSWRVPQFEEDTLLLIRLSDYSYIEAYETWGPANLIYYPESEVPLIAGEVFYRGTVHDILRGVNKEHTHRNITYLRNMNNIIVFSQPSAISCVNAIDGNNIEISSQDDMLVHVVAPFSKIERIQLDSEFHRPPENIFGDEPEHGWCYYYQKASLARQKGDWEAVAQLGDEAIAKGLEAYDRYEWMPFFEAYANIGRVESAKTLAEALRPDYGSRNMTCKRLLERSDFPDNYNTNLIIELLCE